MHACSCKSGAAGFAGKRPAACQSSLPLQPPRQRSTCLPYLRQLRNAAFSCASSWSGVVVSSHGGRRGMISLWAAGTRVNNSKATAGVWGSCKDCCVHISYSRTVSSHPWKQASLAGAGQPCSGGLLLLLLLHLRAQCTPTHPPTCPLLCQCALCCRLLH